MKKLVGYFFQGLLLLAPITITLYIIIKILSWVGSFFNQIGFNIHPLVDPLIGIIMVIGIIIFVGIFGSSIIFRPFAGLFHKAMEKAPLIKMIYGAIKDLLTAFVGSKKKFDQPVLVKINRESEVEKLGFITRENLTELGISKKVAVYLPHSYNFSGDLFIVPMENITPINASSSVVMKFIVSGGITHMD